MSVVTESLGIKYASSQGRKGLRYNKFLCEIRFIFSPVGNEKGGGDDFAWKQVACAFLIFIFF
jgi:hypothetical protein